MRLQRLEINGFKSFSDRSELAFDGDVTAIVGPNGCGKSNVADAITWVMGEQSAKSLRGDKMEDVIFNGSDARKPTAAAEVRLKFNGFVKQVIAEKANGNGHGHNGNGHHPENGNGNGNGHGPADAGHYEAVAEEIIQSVAREVEVTRRLYRSGESEYLIDGQVCRLKDIHDLLMDTGLGAKAYAIIEQGKIGMILSSRPTDRRQLIEEAAGITKYKTKRRAAELKLEETQQNLLRIDDTLSEVTRNLTSLKRQAGKARRHKELIEQLSTVKRTLYRGRVLTARAEQDAAEQNVTAAEGTEKEAS